MLSYRQIAQGKNDEPGAQVVVDLKTVRSLGWINIQRSPSEYTYGADAYLVEARQDFNTPGSSVQLAVRPTTADALDWKAATVDDVIQARYVIARPPAGLILLNVSEAYNNGQPIPVQPPTTNPGPTGPTTFDCVFPTLSWNLISVLTALIQWIGCILHNIITILQWFVDWILQFPDHLDAWISRLFDVDPSLPFFDEVLKKIDIWISGKFGVDPALPFWEELVKKALTWIGGALDAAAEERMRIRGWK